MQSEYCLWGIGPGDTERYQEQLLTAYPASQGVARTLRIQELAAKDGFHSFRVALVDLTTPPDFSRTLTR